MPETDRTPYKSSYYYSSSRTRSSPPKKKPTKKRRLGRVLVVAIVLVAIVAVTLKLTDHHTPKSVAAFLDIKKSSTPTPTPQPGPSKAAIAQMSSTINGVISANSGVTFDVALIDLNNGQEQSYGQDQPMTAASVGKLITAGDFLNEVENGSQTLTEQVGGYSAQYELQQMIVVSDDTAWDNLNNLLTYPQLQTYASTIGITDYNSVNNTFTAQDTAHLLELLYDNKLLNSSDTQLLMGYLEQANYRQYVVPAIPSEDTIYHKIGLYLDNVNDATIVTHGNQAFSLVIFTNGNGEYDWTARATMMQQIAKAALLCYFNQS